jgi:hypothetical protein
MRAPTWPVETLRDALEREYDTDAHLSPVVLVSADGVEAEQPRMNLRALHEAQDAGFEPMIQAVFIDFDNVGHRRWDSPEEASKVVGGLADHPALARAAIYTTRAGWRAVYPVSPAIPLDKLPDVMGQATHIGAGRTDDAHSQPIRFDPVYQIQCVNGNWTGLDFDAFTTAGFAVEALAILLQC